MSPGSVYIRKLSRDLRVRDREVWLTSQMVRTDAATDAEIESRGRLSSPTLRVSYRGSPDRE